MPPWFTDSDGDDILDGPIVDGPIVDGPVIPDGPVLDDGTVEDVFESATPYGDLFTGPITEGVDESLPIGEDFTGPLRDAYDYTFDYSGEFFGEEDSQDLPGPSFNPLGNWFGWNSDQAQDDPTNPDNWGTGIKLLLGGGLIVGGALVFRPYASAGATVVD